MKILPFLIALATPGLALSDTTTSCNDENRCINSETNAYGGFTFTPSYKNQYSMQLLDINDSCEDVDVSDEDKVKLEKNSYFRQTLDKSAQNDNELIVHVYEVDKQDGNAGTTIEKFFSAPHKLCLTGKHRVQKSNYKRVGGVSTGLLVVPFKLRSGDIYSDSTLGPYISYKWEVIELLATAGLSQISVSEVGTEDIKNETGLTYGLGINFEIAKDWDAAFVVGVDHLSGNTGKNWEYQDEPWVSFGLGFNFTR